MTECRSQCRLHVQVAGKGVGNDYSVSMRAKCHGMPVRGPPGQPLAGEGRFTAATSRRCWYGVSCGSRGPWGRVLYQACSRGGKLMAKKVIVYSQPG